MRNKLVIIGIVLFLLVLGIGLFFASQKESSSTQSEGMTTEQTSQAPQTQEEEYEQEAASEDALPEGS